LNVTIIHRKIGKKDIGKVRKIAKKIRKGGEAFKKH